MTQKLPQICTVILRTRIGKVAWFAVYTIYLRQLLCHPVFQIFVFLGYQQRGGTNRIDHPTGDDAWRHRHCRSSRVSRMINRSRGSALLFNGSGFDHSFRNILKIDFDLPVGLSPSVMLSIFEAVSLSLMKTLTLVQSCYCISLKSRFFLRPSESYNLVDILPCVALFDIWSFL